MENMKVCKKCKEEKIIDSFYKNSTNCKLCDIKRIQNFYQLNREVIRKKRRERYYKNIESNLEKKRNYDRENREMVRKRARERYDSEKAKIYYINNKEVIRERNRKWIKENKEYFKILNCKNSTKWMKNNPHVTVWRQILYRTIYMFGMKKEGKTINLLGYSATQLKNHIELLFIEGMSWDNWGEWHIDHIKPMSMFDKSTPISVVNSLSNLQPLWASDNLSKGDKY